MNTQGWKASLKMITPLVLCAAISGCQTGALGSNHPFLTIFHHNADARAVTHPVFKTQLPKSMRETSCDSPDAKQECVVR